VRPASGSLTASKMILEGAFRGQRGLPLRNRYGTVFLATPTGHLLLGERARSRGGKKERRARRQRERGEPKTRPTTFPRGLFELE
jgi:hypothetical protein